MKKMIFKLYSRKTHDEIVTTVFVGEEGGTLQNIGSLRFRTGEWQLFGATLLAGEKVTGQDMMVIQDGWSPEQEEK